MCLQVMPYVAVSTGTSQADLKKLDDILAATGAEIICMDVANGYSEFFVDVSTHSTALRTLHKHTCSASTDTRGEPIDLMDWFQAIKQVRSRHPTKVILAGNVVTAGMTEQLILNGADVVKVGIGPGSVCTTR